MVSLNMTKWGKLGLTGIMSISALSLGACGTTSGVVAQGAPITYKLDQGAVKHASVTQPYMGLTKRPSNSQPTQRQMPYSAPSSALPKAQPQPDTPRHVSQFDQASVDTDLYKHQRIGKRYTILGKSYTPKHQPHYNVVGTASWYGDKFHGRPTATGELFDMDDITAAHKTLPLNSMVYVTNLETGKGLLVRVNDRGPFVDDRIIDLSRASARELGLFNSGLGRVRVQYAGPADPMAAKLNKKPIKRPTTPQIRNMPEPAPELVAQAPISPKVMAQPLHPKAQPLLPKRTPLTLPKLTQDYTSLRELGQKVAPVAQAALPLLQEQQYPFQPKTAPSYELQGNSDSGSYVNPLLGGTDNNPLAQQPVAPQSAQLPGVETPVTLTIKGPIHMATSKRDTAYAPAQFIPAVNYTKKPAVK